MPHCETLDSGLRLVIEPMPSIRSACVAAWIATGSRHERPSEAGVSHLIEHLVFKGAASRSAEEIAVAIDSVGGDLNAATDRETTSYYARVPSDHVDLAIDLVSDVVCRPTLTQQSIDTERQVVLEEIRRYEDTPDELIHDHFCACMWPTNGAGRSILGSDATLNELSRDGILGYYRRRYTAGNAIVSIAGNVDVGEARAMVLERFGDLPAGPPGPSGWERAQADGGGVRCATRDLEQVHVTLGWPAIASSDLRRYTQAVLDGVYGATGSSRLFQQVRENRGLAYSIWSEPILFPDAGALSVYAGTAPENVAELIEVTLAEAAKLADGKFRSDEVRVAREQFKGATALEMEMTDVRASRNARSLLVHGRLILYEEFAQRLDAVTDEDVRDVAREVLRPDRLALAAIGPIEESDLQGILRR